MFDEVQLMRALQFAFAATIVFDAFVAFWVLLAGRADRRLARIYFMTFGVIVLWKELVERTRHHVATLQYWRETIEGAKRWLNEEEYAV